MLKLSRFIFVALLILSVVSACKKDKLEDIDIPKEPEILNTIPEFYLPALEEEYGLISPEHIVVASSEERLNFPQDLEFHPIRKNELWIINRDVVNTGGSVVILTDPGKPDQAYQHKRDGNSWHFMAMPTSMAFSNFGYWATGAGVQDANHSGGTYTGPTLWSSHPDTFAKNFGPGTNGSHLDMLHGSPFSMGIAHDKENVYWVYDGYHKHLARYDFVKDHGPGMHDHSDGRIHRYVEVELNRHNFVPSHMILDKNTGWLYINDTGNNRILRVNTNSGNWSRDIPFYNEPLAQHWEIKGVEWEVFHTSTRNTLCGIELVENRLFVTDFETGDILCFDTGTGEILGEISSGNPGIMGIHLGPDNKLWYVNRDKNQLSRVEPK